MNFDHLFTFITHLLFWCPRNIYNQIGCNQVLNILLHARGGNSADLVDDNHWFWCMFSQYRKTMTIRGGVWQDFSSIVIVQNLSNNFENVAFFSFIQQKKMQIKLRSYLKGSRLHIQILLHANSLHDSNYNIEVKISKIINWPKGLTKQGDSFVTGFNGDIPQIVSPLGLPTAITLLQEPMT